MTLILRPYTQEDVPAILAIEKEAWNWSNSPVPQVSQRTADEFLARNPFSENLVGELAGEIIGVLGYHQLGLGAVCQHVREIDLAIAAKFRRQGYGLKLLKLLQEHALHDGIEKLMLRVLSTNTKAMALYQKAGFEIEGRLKNHFFIQNQFVDDVYMGYFPLKQLVLRPYEISDVPAILAMEELSWDETNTPAGKYQKPTVEEFIASNPFEKYLVGVIGEKIVGAMQYTSNHSSAAGQFVRALDLVIHPEMRRQGYGLQMLEAVKRYAKETGVKKLTLRVLATNPKAIALYQKAGFHEEGRLVQEFYLNNQFVDDILMAYFVESL